MTKFSHFVLHANHDTGEWTVDMDTSDVRFWEGAIWNNVTNEWEKSTVDYETDKRDDEFCREIYALIDEKNLDHKEGAGV